MTEKKKRDIVSRVYRKKLTIKIMVLWNVGKIRRFSYPEKELISSQLLAEPRITTFESFQIFVKILWFQFYVAGIFSCIGISSSWTKNEIGVCLCNNANFTLFSRSESFLIAWMVTSYLWEQLFETFKFLALCSNPKEAMHRDSSCQRNILLSQRAAKSLLHRTLLIRSNWIERRFWISTIPS